MHAGLVPKDSSASALECITARIVALVPNHDGLLHSAAGIHEVVKPIVEIVVESLIHF